MPKRPSSKAKSRKMLSLLSVLIFLLTLYTSISIYLRQEKEMERLAAEHEELLLLYEAEERQAKEIAELEAIVGSDQYIERVARDKLGLVRPDEIIFIQR